jgi:hypothetical protein
VRRGAMGVIPLYEFVTGEEGVGTGRDDDDGGRHAGGGFIDRTHVCPFCHPYSRLHVCNVARCEVSLIFV